MDLFEQLEGKPHNLLPCDGTVHYYGKILSQVKANEAYKTLLEKVAWQHDEAVIMGERIKTKRKVAWYGDCAFPYEYSRTTKIAQPWFDELLGLKSVVEEQTGEVFNSCLLNLYHNGDEGMAWHSDAEKALKKNGAIASLSLGAERKFAFKHKRLKQVVSKVLQHGSLLVMKDATQTNWLHRLPPTKTINTPRINLTFRTIVTSL